MKDMKKLKQMAKDLYEALHADDSEVIDEKQQYSRDDDQGEESDGEDARVGNNYKVKSMAAMLKKKMQGDA